MTNLRSNLRWFPILKWTDEKIIAVWRWNIKAFSHDVRSSCTGLALEFLCLSIPIVGGGFMQFTGAKMHGRVREGTKMFKTIWICVTDRPKMEGQWCWGAWVPLEENVSHSFFSSFSHLVWFLLGVPYVFYPSVPLILTLSIFAISLPLVLSSHAYSVEYDVIIKSHQLPDNMSDASMSECVDDITQCQPREEVGGSLSLSSYEPILFLLKRKDERIIFSL